eukprot:2208570-Prymnesium_polylepis.1
MNARNATEGQIANVSHSDRHTTQRAARTKHDNGCSCTNLCCDTSGVRRWGMRADVVGNPHLRRDGGGGTQWMEAGSRRARG